MERTLTYNITQNDIPNTLHSFLRAKGYSSQIIKELKKEPERILIDGKWKYTKHTLKAGESITYTYHILFRGQPMTADELSARYESYTAEPVCL